MHLRDYLPLFLLVSGVVKFRLFYLLISVRSAMGGDRGEAAGVGVRDELGRRKAVHEILVDVKLNVGHGVADQVDLVQGSR